MPCLRLLPARPRRGAGHATGYCRFMVLALLRLRLGLGLGLALGCASSAGDIGSRASKLRGDVGELVRVRSTLFDELHQRPGVSFAVYRALLIEPVELAPDLDTRDQRYRPADLERLRRRADRALQSEFGDWEDLALASAPGPGVLRLRMLLTQLRANRPPFDMTEYGTATSTRGVGGAAAQIELRDASGDALLLAIVDRHWGHEFSTNLNTRTTWGDAEDAIRWWARMLRSRLEKERGGS